MVKKNVDLQGAGVLVTGAAGFIGSALCARLLSEYPGIRVTGIDNMNDYYDVAIKEERLSRLSSDPHFTFIRGDIADKELVTRAFAQCKPDVVVNLAAQAGVRYSITHPDSYIRSNLIGFYNILEACRHSYDGAAAGYAGVRHLVYASSSSVYGTNAKIPYSTDDKVDHPVSLYAATKKSDELMAHAYAKLYNIPSTGLRFFTVYGAAGRRDFTYIDDIVEGVVRVMQGAPERQSGADGLPIAPYRIYNIGNGHPVDLLDFVDILQQELVAADVLPQDYDFEAHKELVPMQPGDVPVTYADTTALEQDFGYRPRTDLRTGLRTFAVWYKKFYCEG